LARYADGPTAYLHEALKQPTARAVVERLFAGVVDLLTDPHNPGGCLWVRGMLTCVRASDTLRGEMIARRTANAKSLKRRFAAAKAKGELPPHVSPAELAQYVQTVMVGLAVQAAGGANKRELKQATKTALRVWPGMIERE
jgi:hypothetical protein